MCSLLDRVDFLEKQVAMLTDLLAESRFRERLTDIEDWVVDWEAAMDEAEEIIVFEADPALLRDKNKDN